jgi:hypothetical protein
LLVGSADYGIAAMPFTISMMQSMRSCSQPLLGELPGSRGI